MLDEIRTVSVVSKPGRVVFGRILPGTDAIEGILKICAENDIRYGNIVTMIGSLARGTFVYAVPREGVKMGIIYSQPFEVEGPLEFLGGQGVIGTSDQGIPSVHLHGLLSDRNRNIYGGHITDKGNPVLVTMEVVIQVLDDVKLIRSRDGETDFPLFKPYPAV